MVGLAVGFEPTACRLQGGCTAIVLRKHEEREHCRSKTPLCVLHFVFDDIPVCAGVVSHSRLDKWLRLLAVR